MFRYTHDKPDDLELVFSIAKSEIEFYRSDADGSKLIRLLHGNVYYELNEDNNAPFLQVRNRNGKVIFKSYCVELT